MAAGKGSGGVRGRFLPPFVPGRGQEKEQVFSFFCRINNDARNTRAGERYFLKIPDPGRKIKQTARIFLSMSFPPGNFICQEGMRWRVATCTGHRRRWIYRQSPADKLLAIGCRVTVVDNLTLYDPAIKEENIKIIFDYNSYRLIRRYPGSETLRRKLRADYDLIIHLAARAEFAPVLRRLYFIRK